MLAISACGTSVSDEAAADLALQAGLNAHRAGDLVAAAAFYREVLMHDPQNEFAYYNLGLIDHTNGDLIEAESNYRIAIGIDPNFAPALYNLAIVRQSAAASQEAVDLYRRVIAIEPANAGAHLNLGLLLRSLGQTEEGDAEVEVARQLDPSLGPSSDASLPPPDAP
jgi:Tfp pilus assembly protein PilF